MNAATGPAGQRAAWDAYVSITIGLLPVLYDPECEHGTDGWAQVNPRLGGVAVRIRRSAPMWDHDGPILTAAASSAIRLYRHGDRPALIALAHAMAHRLFLLTIGTVRPHHPNRRSRNAAWNKRFELDTERPGIPQQRNMRHHGPRHDEKGIDDD
ncbi:hypothetical protein OHA72_56395 [Dactylosporangium sp. NBC_01737]|uniref:hypothetical protein n=1 Tax=Dactylosporangium sp. NBC_01737 TaxID=2975959 RepID=UPI002E128455|nr:hypothetical protein OHA72_56395 [Dactylosporangium sp. NBC_01737]